MKTISVSFFGDDLTLTPSSPSLVSTLRDLGIPVLLNQKGHVQVRPVDFFIIWKVLQSRNWNLKFNFKLDFELELQLQPSFELYDYQRKSMLSWKKQDYRGIVVLPTGSGKSFVGLQAMMEMKARTLIVVPTLALLDQWLQRITEYLGVASEDIGQLGGGIQEIKEITVSTYDSASLYVRAWRTKAGLIIFDEVHHLIGRSYRIISEGSLAPARLGLTATLPEDKKARQLLFQLVGPVVSEYKPSDLRNSGRIADYMIKTIEVELTEEQKKEYEKIIAPFKQYLRDHRLGSNAFQKLIYRINQDPKAREALMSYQRARLYAFNLPSKVVIVERLLERHLRQGDQVLIFSESVPFVEELSRTFLIPLIVHHTPSSERAWLLEQFKRGNIRVLASGKVLDEGIDVPSATVGIIVSGTGQKRQFIQRLGRILRRKEDGRPAILYDIVTKDSTEERLAKRRKKTSL